MAERTSGGNRKALHSALQDAMRRFTNQVTFYSFAVASSAGLHPTDLDCLSAIELDGPLTAGRLADATGLTTGAVTGVLDRLERGGYIRREPDPNDRRRVQVRVVPESLAALRDAFAPMLESSTSLYSRYDDEDLAVITDWIVRSTPMLREETLRLRDRVEHAADATHEADRGDAIAFGDVARRDATLRIAHGAARLVVTARPGQAQLFSAQWWGSRPTTREDGDTVLVQYRRSPFGHFRTRGDVVLDATARWTLDLQGGLANSQFHLREARVAGVDIRGGSSTCELQLPRPQGEMTVDIRGGVHAMSITRPAGVPARVTIRGGASNLVLDDQRFGAIGGRTDIQTDGYADAETRLLINVHGGSSSLSVTTS